MSKIIHIGDIHIPMIARIPEYGDILPNVIQAIKIQKPDLICLVGDLGHNKTVLSPEQFVLIVDFSVSLARIAPLVVILGQHDINLTSNKMDIVSALRLIVSELKSNKLPFYFSPNTNVYMFKDLGVAITGYSILDDKPLLKPTNNKLTNVCLYHGLIYGASVDSGWIFDENTAAMKVSDFDGYDIVMLGDIHKYQTFRKNNTMAYCGSLIQQDHGEDPNKGFVVWDTDDFSHKFIPVPNPYTFNTLVLDKRMRPIKPYPPNNCHLRVHFSLPRNLVNNTDRKTITNIVNSEFSPRSITYAYQQISAKLGEGFDVDAQIVNIKDQKMQQELIVKWCKHLNYDEGTTKKLLELDHSISEESALKRLDIECHNWYLKRLSIKNFLSHKDTVIDFTQYRGVVGIFGNNRSGKSVIIDAILYVIFGKTSRSSDLAGLKNLFVDDDTLVVELDVKIDNELYRIIRKTKANKDGTSKNNLNYSKFVDDEWIPQNRDNKSQTEKLLKQTFGEYDDFIMSVVSTQDEINQFIKATPTPRAKLVLKYLGFDVFEIKHAIINTVKSKLFGARSTIDVGEIDELITEHQNTLISVEQLKVDVEQSIGENNKKLKKIRKEIVNISEQIVSEYIFDETEEEIREKIDELMLKAKKLNEKYNLAKQNLKNIVEELGIKNSEVEYDTLEEIVNLKDEIKHKNSEVIIINGNIVSCNHIINDNKQLSEFECPVKENEKSLSCPFVNKINEAKQVIIEQCTALQKFNNKLKKTKKQIEDLQEKYDNFNDVRLSIEGLRNRMTENQSVLDRCISEIEVITLSVHILNEKINKFEQNREIIENNSRLIEAREKLKIVERTLNDQINDDLDEKIKIVKNIGLLNDKINNLNAKLVEARMYDEELKIYDLYEKMVHRDGIPISLLEKYIPIINSNINAILSSLVDYTIHMYVDERRDLQIDCGEDDEYYRTIGLSSGVEKMLVAMSIRIVLTLISNLSHPHLWIIDEGFGTLDHEFRGKISNLFDILRELFPTVLIITHIEFIKDLVDDQILVIKNNHISVVEEINRGKKKR